MKIEEFIQQKFGSLVVLQAAIRESRKLLPEGAMTNEGLYWISPKGKVILVNNLDTLNKKYSMGHEEYANRHWHCSLEDALHKGYLRLQAVSPQYLFIDHAQQALRHTQVPALTGFFFNEQMQPIHYEQMLIERAGDTKTFKKGQNNAALQFAVTGTADYSTPEEEPIGAVAADTDLASMHPAYKRPGVNPFGDSTHSFGKWLAERTKEE